MRALTPTSGCCPQQTPADNTGRGPVFRAQALLTLRGFTTQQTMGSYRMCHRATGIAIAGYRVLSATEEEIAQANCRLRETGTPFRFVPDTPEPQARAIGDAPTTLTLSSPTA